MHRLGAAPVHDALAVCAVIDPTVITTQFIHVDVETGGELSQGRTVCDFRGRSRKEPNVHFAMDADEPKFVAMLTGDPGPDALATRSAAGYGAARSIRPSAPASRVSTSASME